MEEDQIEEKDTYDIKVCHLISLFIGIDVNEVVVQVKFVNAISQPLASRKMTKKLHKLVKKATLAKSVRRGVKEVSKAIRKGEIGLLVIAGDISPVDVVTHLPVMCEDRKIPYIYVPSKLDLGAAAQTKRPTSCILVSPKEAFAEKSLFDKLSTDALEANPIKF